MNEDLSPHRDSAPGMPRWVKVFGVIGVVVLLIIVMLLTGHGPDRHLHGGPPGHGTSVRLAPGGVTAFVGHLA